MPLTAKCAGTVKRLWYHSSIGHKYYVPGSDRVPCSMNGKYEGVDGKLYCHIHVKGHSTVKEALTEYPFEDPPSLKHDMRRRKFLSHTTAGWAKHFCVWAGQPIRKDLRFHTIYAGRAKLVTVRGW